MIAYYCSCGWSTTQPQDAFRHRDDKHVIRPLTRDEAVEKGLTVPFDSNCGIDKHFAMEEEYETVRDAAPRL